MKIGIFGLGRSGTSLLSKHFINNGFFIHDPNWANENKFIKKYHEKILKKRGAKNGKLPYGDPDIPLNYDSLKYDEMVKKFLSLNPTKNIVIKDPRLSLFLPHWVKHLDIIIWCFRRPSEVTSSYIHHGFINMGKKNKNIMEKYWIEFNEMVIPFLNNDNIHLIEFTDEYPLMINKIMKYHNIPITVPLPYKSKLKHFTLEKKEISLYNTLKSSLLC